MAVDNRVKFGAIPVRAEYAAAQTGTELVAATTGKRIFVDMFIISADAAGNAKLLSATTTIGPKLYYGVNGGAVIEKMDALATAVSAALNITTVSSGNHSIYLEYHLE